MHNSMLMGFVYACKFLKPRRRVKSKCFQFLANKSYCVSRGITRLVLNFCVYLQESKLVRYIFRRKKGIMHILDFSSELVNLGLITTDLAKAFYYTRLHCVQSKNGNMRKQKILSRLGDSFLLDEKK